MKSGCFRLFRFIHILVRLKRLRFDKSDTIYRYFYQHDKLIDNQLAYWRYTVSTRKKIEHFSLVMSCLYFAFCKWNSEFWTLKSRKPSAQGMRNPTKDWNLESKFHWQRISRGIQCLESRIQDSISWISLPHALCSR